MKRLIFCILFAVVSSCMFSTTWHVYHGDSIQDVINQAAHEDIIYVHYYYTGYHGFSYTGKDLDIIGIGSPFPTINGDLSNPSLSTIVDISDIENPQIGHSATPSLQDFNIIGSSTATGVLVTGFVGSFVDILRNNIDGVGKCIASGGNDDLIRIYGNELINSTYGYYAEEPIQSNAGSPDDLYNNVIFENTYGLYLCDYGNAIVTLGLLYDNDFSAYLASSYSTLTIGRSTIANTSSSNTDTGFYTSPYTDLTISNCILYDNETQIDNNGGTISVTYSDVEGGYLGDGNISADPNFCKISGYEFHLIEGSPCIDTGDPESTLTGIDVRIDMGCFETTYDVKECEGQSWNWVSYPRLYRTNNDSVDVVPLLENFLDWDFDLKMLYRQIFYLNPALEYEIQYTDWTPDEYFVKSSLGYKLDPDDSGDHYLPTVTNATRLADDWELEYTLEAEDACWLGYWLPYTQNIEDAFGEFWEDVFSVDAEDWYYERSQFETPTSSTFNKNLVYGKGYIVVFDTDIEDFFWTDATDSRSYGSPGNPEPEPQYFEFADQANYEAIDVMEIPGNVVEIGVYEEDTCVGAVVVQAEDEQILVYSTEANRDNVPLSFQVVTTNRSENLIVSDYKVMNKETGRWENRSLISGNQRSSIVMFGNLLEPVNPNSSFQISNLSNYPNPFNPTTTISFDLSSELTEDTEINIYNMKGQKVKTLPVPQSQNLTVSVSWDGTDNEGKNVSSGLYFYKLKTADNEYSKKMLLLK